jgi:uncharacterized protein YdhG (YjbR/CyaY superfamily)
MANHGIKPAWRILMREPLKEYQTIDEFIIQFPPEVQAIMQKLRSVIHEMAPEATEAIAYGIPTFTFHGNLVHFSAYRHHIGFYPTSSGISQFKDHLTQYEISKGTVRFPIDQPLPYDLIRDIVAYRVNENLTKSASKKRK